MKENNTKLINEWLEFVKALKEFTNKKFDEYISDCDNELCSISTFLKVRFRDGIEYLDFVEKLYALFSKTCSKYNIDENAILNRMNLVCEKNNYNSNYYDIVDKEIRLIMSELQKKLNNKDVQIK